MRGTRGATTTATGCALIALLVMVGIGAAASPVLAGTQAPAASPAVAKPRIRLAVVPFSGPAAGVPEEFGQALSETIRHALRQVRAVHLIESDTIVEAQQRLKIPLADVLSDDAAMKLAREIQARGLVAGVYSVEGDTLKVQAKIADLREAGQSVAREEIAGPLADFLVGQERIARQILQHFQVQVSPHDEKRLKAAFTRPTNSLEGYTLYARAMWQQGLRTKEGHGRAIPLFEKALEKDQNFVLAHYGLGISLNAANNRWKASGEIRKAVQLDPNFADGYRWLGDMLLSSPRRISDQAIQAYQKAVELSPDYAEAFVGLGDARQAKGQYDEAIAEYQKALALEPENARVHYGLGKIYYNEKQLYHEAVAEYEQAIRLDSKLMEAHLSLAELYEEKGLYREAIERYGQVLTIEPRHPGATYGLALVYERVDTKKAIEQWERYIELASSLPSEKEWVDIARKHLNKLRRGE